MAATVAAPGATAYLNGAFLPAEDARISPDDRGFLFADGVYEVLRVYAGRPFLLQDHLARLTRGLAALRIAAPAGPPLDAVAGELVRRNGLQGGDASVYLQVTRGVGPRQHAFPPPGTPPTVYASARRLLPAPPERAAEGVAAVLVPDLRWGRCDLKTVGLLPNVLAKQEALDRGVFEALFVRRGAVMEGSHTSLFAVQDGVLVTPPAGPSLLAGVTRRWVLALARAAGLAAEERPLRRARLVAASEAFLCGTTTEIAPLVRLDGRPLGDGKPGPVTRRLQGLFADALANGLSTFPVLA